MSPSSITELRHSINTATDTGERASIIEEAVSEALAHSNQNQSRNTYLWQNPDWTQAEQSRVLANPSHDAPLFGIPVSIKDCFDLAGAPTSCGTHYYRDLNGIAAHDSWLVHHLRQQGAIITGKTHLHPLAYGITGENPDFGDCLQPGDPTSLTGGSSSGAAASILEGSALAAIGTDTGGSIRVPAALCGIAGYRSTHGLYDESAWRGGAHLAQSFDTLGWLFRHLEDAPLLGQALGVATQSAAAPTSFAVVSDSFYHDCEPAVLTSLRQSQAELESLGLKPVIIDIDWWHDSMEIFAPIQASEGAAIHRGHFEREDQAHNFEPSIRQRLLWGSSLTREEVSGLRQRHATFRDRMDAILAQHELLLLPAAPVTRLPAGADHSQTRTRLLRYTSPISLSGMPAITLPYFDASGEKAGGMQLVAARHDDARLLALAAKIGQHRRAASNQ